jgi:hypothetical protein
MPGSGNGTIRKPSAFAILFLGGTATVLKKTINMIFLSIAAIAIPLTVFAQSGKEMTKLLGIQIGEARTLRDVQKRLGNTPIIETGEAGEYKATVCYYVPKCRAKVEFWSSELGGDEHYVIGFTLTRTTNPEKTCRMLTLDNCGGLRSANGIYLGMQINEFRKVLGAGIEIIEDFYQITFESQKSMTEKERRRLSKSMSSPLPTGLIWDIVIHIQGTFSASGLDVFEVSKTQTF